MTAAPAIKLSGMNIVDKTIDEAIIAEPPAKPTSNTRTIEEISAELNAEWISDIIAHMAESARRNPDARSQMRCFSRISPNVILWNVLRLQRYSPIWIR